MNLPLKDRITLLAKLGNYIGSENTGWKNVKETASLHNNWFIPEFVSAAMREIQEAFLDEQKLRQWISKYPVPEIQTKPGKAGIVMAGNLPAVGFHDLLCGFLSGHRVILKLSSKDKILIPHFINKLTEWEPAVNAQITIADHLRNCDAYIATGSNNSARYFHQYFGRYPHIIRSNRTAAAILDGDESAEELEKLADDILMYFGLGCRNVTKIYVPEGYDFVPLLESMKKYTFLKELYHYKNNFDYQLSLLLLNKAYYMTNNLVLLKEHEALFSPVSVLHYEFYTDKQKCCDSLKGNKDLQCIVSRDHVPFGAAQRPRLDDYADGADTMEFLTSL